MGCTAMANWGCEGQPCNPCLPPSGWLPPAAGGEGGPRLGGGRLGPRVPGAGGVQRRTAQPHRRLAQHRCGAAWTVGGWGRGQVVPPGVGLSRTTLPPFLPRNRDPATLSLPPLQRTSPRRCCSITSACWPRSPPAASTPRRCWRRGCCATGWPRRRPSWRTWRSRTRRRRHGKFNMKRLRTLTDGCLWGGVRGLPDSWWRQRCGDLPAAGVAPPPAPRPPCRTRSSRSFPPCCPPSPPWWPSASCCPCWPARSSLGGRRR